MKFNGIFSAAALALVCLISSCKGDDSIKIGVYGPFTGGSAPMGTSMRNGVQLAVEEINAAGGINGKKVVLVDRDDQAKPDIAPQVVQELLEKENCVALLGPINTGCANPSTKYANAKKIPQIINVSAGANVNELFATSPDNYIFRNAANDYIQTEMIVKEAVDVKKKVKLALLCDETPFGQGGFNKMKSVLVKRNVTPVYEGKFKIKDTDMSAQLLEAKKAGADVILCYGIGPELAAVANSMEKIQWKVDIIGSWTLCMNNFIDNAKQNGNGATMPQTFIEASPGTDKAKKFIADYQKKFNVPQMSVAVAAAQGYDSMYLLKDAMEAAKTTDGPKLKAALENLSTFTGVTGVFPHPFSATDHELIKAENVTMGIVKNGKVEK